MAEAALDAQVQAVRRFNRFYTQQVGLLGEGHLESPFSLTAVRVLYEMAHRESPTASELAAALGLDAGYLSRLLKGFEKRGLVSRRASPTDARQSHLALTPAGRKTAAALEARASAEIAALLERLSPAERPQLVHAMQTLQQLLALEPASREPYLLRPHRAGDMGWVVARHGALYAQEYGWDTRFEALVARIVADFIDNLDPARERCWIAEREGQNVGSIFLVKSSKTVAKLRLLLVEPSARGLGICRKLVEECVRFAREAGYQKITLWTQDVLKAARHLYAEAGFVRVQRGKHHSFGHDLVEEIWELELRSPRSAERRAQR